MPRNSMKQNITQVIAWMKVNNFMKETAKKESRRRGRKPVRKKNFR
jgi:hypothetical protein